VAPRAVETGVEIGVIVITETDLMIAEIEEFLRSVRKPSPEPEPQPKQAPDATVPPKPDPKPDRKGTGCHLKQPFRPGKIFRRNLACFTGQNYLSGPVGFDAHHVFPKADEFQWKFDLILGPTRNHAPWYGSWWEWRDHQSRSGKYNQRWREFFLSQTPSAAIYNETRGFGRQLMIEAGQRVYF